MNLISGLLIFAYFASSSRNWSAAKCKYQYRIVGSTSSDVFSIFEYSPSLFSLPHSITAAAALRNIFFDQLTPQFFKLSPFFFVDLVFWLKRIFINIFTTFPSKGLIWKFRRFFKSVCANLSRFGVHKFIPPRPKRLSRWCPSGTRLSRGERWTSPRCIAVQEVFARAFMTAGLVRIATAEAMSQAPV